MGQSALLSAPCLQICSGLMNARPADSLVLMEWALGNLRLPNAHSIKTSESAGRAFISPEQICKHGAESKALCPMFAGNYLYHHRCAQQIQHRLGKVDPFFQAHAFAVGEVGDFFAKGGGMDETGAGRELMC